MTGVKIVDPFEVDLKYYTLPKFTHNICANSFSTSSTNHSTKTDLYLTSLQTMCKNVSISSNIWPTYDAFRPLEESIVLT
jgi:hypothetical protein